MTATMLPPDTREVPDRINEALFREVLAWIELHPERWDQTVWTGLSPCGTTHCLAGWTYVLSAAHPISYSRHHTGELLVPGGGTIKQFAKAELGLTEGEARELFFFTTVHVPGPENHGMGTYRAPTFADLCEKVEEVTGIRFKPAETTTHTMEPPGEVRDGG